MSNRVQSLSVILRGICRQLGLQNEMTLYQIQAHWEEIVGPQIALHTAPEKISYHALSLRVDSAPWMNQLLFFKREMVEKTNRFLTSQDIQQPFIQDVYLKMAPLYPAASLRPFSSQKVLSGQPSASDKRSTQIPKEVATLKEAINAFQDETLKRIVQKALSGYFREEPTEIPFEKKRSSFVRK